MFSAYLKNGHHDDTLASKAVFLAFEQRTGFFAFKKLKILRMNQGHRSVSHMLQRFDPPPPIRKGRELGRRWAFCIEL
jgi:hypothetical protein